NGFVGVSMGDISVILLAVVSEKSRRAFYRTVHRVGRIMSRTKAAGRSNWKQRKRTGGALYPQRLHKALRDIGVLPKRGGTNEGPFVYRKLKDVLDAHEGTVEVLHELKPIGVVMAEG